MDGNFCGAVSVFRYDGAAWASSDDLTNPAGMSAEFFGNALSLDGTSLVVGATGAGSPKGAVYLFEAAGSQWTQEAVIARESGPESIGFAYSLALQGDTLAVGAISDGCPSTGSSCGSVFIYRRNGQTWENIQKISASDGASLDDFGASVALSGDALLVGAPGVDCSDGSSACGAVYVYTFDGLAWGSETKIASQTSQHGDQFGSSVAIQGNWMLIGAPGPLLFASTAGYAHLYRYENGQWIFEAKLEGVSSDVGSNFGNSVAISGRTAVIGAPFAFGPPEYSGLAYTFDLLPCAEIPAASGVYLALLAVLLV